MSGAEAGAPRPDFPDYDEAVAAGFASTDLADDPGLPGFLGIRHTGAGAGWLTAEMDVDERLITAFGTAHGGVVSGLVDHVLGSVCYPVMPRGWWAATTEFKVNLLRPIRLGPVEARAEIVSMSRRTAVVRIDVVHDGRLAAAAQGTVSLQAPK